MSVIYVWGVPSDEFSKKEIKDIYHGIYDNEALSLEFHSIVDNLGYVVFDILGSYDFDGFSVTDLVELKEKAIKDFEPKKEAIIDFLNKVNKPHLIDQLDGYLYKNHESFNDEFYRKMGRP